MELTKENIIELSRNAISDDLIEIVKVNINGPEANKLVSLEIWHPDIVDLSMCEKVSSEINAILDEDDPFENSYTLEIASLPLTRKLETFDDFRRTLNETITIKFKDKQKEEQKGKLLKADEKSLTLEIKGNSQELTLADIRSGKIIF